MPVPASTVRALVTDGGLFLSAHQCWSGSTLLNEHLGSHSPWWSLWIPLPASTHLRPFLLPPDIPCPGAAHLFLQHMPLWLCSYALSTQTAFCLADHPSPTQPSEVSFPSRCHICSGPIPKAKCLLQNNY